MSAQRTKVVWAALGLATIAAMGIVSDGDAQEYRQGVLAYCEGVAIWEAEKARGIPRTHRAGHLDWNDRIEVAEQCPGMRPAAPAVTTSQRQFASQ